MVPRNVLGKWKRDSDTFCVECLHSESERAQFRVGTAETGVEFLKLLDDPERTRKTVIVLAHGALNRRLADNWVKLAVLQAATKGRHGVAELRERLARFAPAVLGLERRADKNQDVFERLLKVHPTQWKEILIKHEWLAETDDDPVPEKFADVLEHLDLSDVFHRVVDVIPKRVSANLKERLKSARDALNRADDGVLPPIWKAALKHMKLSLPLLILDEAHHVRNAGTQLATLLAATREDLEEAGGQLSGRFDRMLFLTATPFQLGHAELCNVLSRFDAINWKGSRTPAMSREDFEAQLAKLRQRLDAMQMATERLERAWKRVVTSDLEEAARDHGPQWWERSLAETDPECLAVLNERLRGVMLAYGNSRRAIRAAEADLKPWVLRSSRSPFLPAPHHETPRRLRYEGAAVLGEIAPGVEPSTGGLKVTSSNALPFLLAARLTTLEDGRLMFAEGIASSYEALLDTRRDDVAEDHSSDSRASAGADSGAWFAKKLRGVVEAIDVRERVTHPKVKTTVDLAMALWRQGEKVLIFCYYQQTGRALHRYLSEAMLGEIQARACAQIGCAPEEAESELRRLADHFDRDRPAAQQAVALIDELIEPHPALQGPEIRAQVQDIVLRFLRTPTFLVRFADLTIKEITAGWVASLFERRDASDLSLRDMVSQFLEALDRRSSDSDRRATLEALGKVQTGTHAGPEVHGSFSDDEAEASERVRLAGNVRRVYGATRPETRDRIMLTFNTPFYPEILITSSVMAEGVDLHLNCRHVLHHDLDWNPSSLEQRTGRIDRLGSKAERSGQSIQVYLPYLEGCQDEKLFRVVMDRERWFGVVMGAEASMERVLNASAWEAERMASAPLVPSGMVEALKLRLAPE
jgi:hypothetical protein